MPKISNRPLTLLPRVRIWADDYEYLNQLSASTEMGFASFVREILSEYVATVKAQANQTIDEQLSPLIEDDEELNRLLNRTLTFDPT